MSPVFSTQLSLLSTVVVTLLFTASALAQKTSAENYVSGELLVKFRDGVSSKSARRAHVAMSSAVVETLGDLGWQRVGLPEGLSIEDAIKRYSKLDGVEFAQPNFYYRLQLTPNDALFGSLWGMTKISAPAAWDLSTGSSSVVVANIDTGSRFTHQDLAANIWTNPGEINGNNIDDDGNGFIDDFYGWDFRFNDPDPADEHGHGTHTAGTIGAVGNNLVGVVGVNWNVRIMTIKIFSSTGADTTSAMLINAYNYVRMMKNRGVNIRVTNNSYGGCPEACGYDQATKDAIDAMGDAGILNVFAAGNNGTDNDVTPFYPASYTSPSIMSVGGTNQSDERVFNYGVNSVDLAAPATGILSTTRGSDSSYGNSSGTSMATPHVSGAAALLAALNPSLSMASLKATLMNSVDVLESLRRMNRTRGRLNVDRALRNQTVCTFPTSMTVPTKGGIFTLNLAPGTNCEYFVRSEANWIKILGTKQFSGSGTLTLFVTVNPTIARTGNIKFGEQTFTVTQSRN